MMIYNVRGPSMGVILSIIFMIVCLGVGLFFILDSAHGMPPHGSLYYRASDSTKLRPLPPFVGESKPTSIYQAGLNEPSSFNMLGHIEKGNSWTDLRIRDLIPWADPSPTEFRMLAILVEFRDVQGQVEPSYFDSLLFSTVSGTARDYYREASYARLDILTEDDMEGVGWLRVSAPMGDYVGGSYGFGSYPRNSQGLVEELLLLADPFIDFSDYDNDGDGVVDGLTIIHTGPGAEFTGSRDDIWSHKWNLRNPPTLDGVTFDAYSIQPEYWQAPGDMTIGVYVHEWGHVLGLGDLYDTDGSSAGIGRWGVMSSGSWNGRLGDKPALPCAFSRMKFGFAEVIDVRQDEFYVWRAAQSDTVYRMWASGFPGPFYYLIDYRSRYGYDEGLPGQKGVMILRIDETKGGNSKEWIPGTDPNVHPKVAVIQADNEWHLENRSNSGDSGDLYAEEGVFSSESQPSSDWYTGENTDVTITVSPFVPTNPLFGGAHVRVGSCNCPHFADMDEDGDIDVDDFLAIRRIAFYGDLNVQYVNCPNARGDVDCDGDTDVHDLVRMIGVVFRGHDKEFCKPCQ